MAIECQVERLCLLCMKVNAGKERMASRGKCWRHSNSSQDWSREVGGVWGGGQGNKTIMRSPRQHPLATDALDVRHPGCLETANFRALCIFAKCCYITEIIVTIGV